MSDATHQPVIISAARTPIGRYLGGLASLSAPDLGAIVIRAALSRANIAPEAGGNVIIGNVVLGGVGQAPARPAALRAGLPGTVSALTVNKVCGSGLEAVMLAAASIKAGDEEVVVAGGMESMSNAPYYVYGYRGGVKFGDQTLVDGLIKDGLWCSFCDVHMGSHADYTARKANVTRLEQDMFAVQSHAKAIAAIEGGRFKAEIVPVEVRGKKGTTVVDTDEGPRKDTTVESLARLRPAFAGKNDADERTVTAGNASSLNDGAAAVTVVSEQYAIDHGLEIFARITGYATGGTDPQDLFFAPIVAVQKLMQKSGTHINDYDLIEANEAFASQSIADAHGLGWDTERVNVNGGAIALGHPLGASGARLLTTLLYALKDRGKRTGLATLCLGGGNAVALSVERPS
jgi:acetyl-CoA C-acetyltransferase